MQIDPYILAFSAVTVIATIWMGFWAARKSKTAGDFFVAGRSVSVGWNASAISGEYLSAASFMGVAGMVMSSGYDALWYPVCYACGYLFLLLFIAGPLRRFGAYTIPDFADGRFDSPLFRKIAVIFVLFIGFFYTMPQMKGAGTTLAYVFQDVDLRGGWLEFLAPHNAAGEAIKGFPYSAGVLIVGAVITLNVALGGMKGITLVQAFQYWAKMFAISVPIFVLMAVYGHYGKQIEIQKLPQLEPETVTKIESGRFIGGTAINGFILLERHRTAFPPQLGFQFVQALNTTLPIEARTNYSIPRKYFYSLSLFSAAIYYSEAVGRSLWIHTNLNVDAELGPFEVKTRDSRSDDEKLEAFLNDHGYIIQRHPTFGLRLVNQEFSNQVAVPDKAVLSQQQLVDRKGLPNKAPHDYNWVSPFGPLTSKAAAKAGLRPEEQRAYALLYTYSLIIALVCGTAGLPHILVRFYTNPNGVAAKRTTMWVMILIGVFYLFPPIFGVMGRNLLPELYSGVGAKGTDKIVLELPRILNENGSATVPVAPSGVSPDSPRAERVSAKTPKPAGETPALPEKKRIPWGSILSGITCAGAFAAFMSTFSGLLVSMTGALAHDVYGRMLRPKSTPAERMRMFKWCAVIVGGIAILLGSRVEKLEINFMVGQAFAIAAASYFPLLFMSVWWRKLTMKGAAAGTLTGGLLALLGISLTSFTTLGLLKWDGFWAVHPLLRILCEQPAIWAVPLAITLMVVVSKLTAKEIPADIRMKMLVLHAPEKLGLKQEYIQEHQHGH